MTTTLITGANKGLGDETARRLIEAGHEVWVGPRDPERGEKAAADLTDNQGVQTVHQATDVIVELATIGADGPTGTSRSRHGVVAW